MNYINYSIKVTLLNWYTISQWLIHSQVYEERKTTLHMHRKFFEMKFHHPIFSARIFWTMCTGIYDLEKIFFHCQTHSQTGVNIPIISFFLILKHYYRLTSAVMVENLALGDGQEGIKAFIEKRKPTWSHRNDKVHWNLHMRALAILIGKSCDFVHDWTYSMIQKLWNVYRVYLWYI